MKRLRPQRWSGPLLRARQGARPSRQAQSDCQLTLVRCARTSQSRSLSTTVSRNTDLETDASPPSQSDLQAPLPGSYPALSTRYPAPAAHPPITGAVSATDALVTLPSPPPSRARASAKLAALHARLSLPASVPLETVARCLVSPSADPHPAFNNGGLALVGRAATSYHAAELLLARFPRLPMEILYGAVRAYCGPETLEAVADGAWGLEEAAMPGGEVDPGLVQFAVVATEGRGPEGEEGKQRDGVSEGQKQQPPPAELRRGAPPEGVSFVRTLGQRTLGYRVGTSSKAVMDDEFGRSAARRLPRPADDGDVSAQAAGNSLPQLWPPPPDASHAAYASARRQAYADAAHALVGAVSLHAGRAAAKRFVQAHVLSRKLDVAGLFAFGGRKVVGAPNPSSGTLASRGAGAGRGKAESFRVRPADMAPPAANPTRELALLCRREGFEDPVARLLSETGRLSKTPVFVVGIYSGRDKLGEGVGSSLDEARFKAAASSLKAWYLYSPPPVAGGFGGTRVPSDMWEEGKDGEDVDGADEMADGRKGRKKWEPLHVDIGEIVTG